MWAERRRRAIKANYGNHWLDILRGEASWPRVCEVQASSCAAEGPAPQTASGVTRKGQRAAASFGSQATAARSSVRRNKDQGRTIVIKPAGPNLGWLNQSLLLEFPLFPKCERAGVNVRHQRIRNASSLTR